MKLGKLLVLSLASVMMLSACAGSGKRDSSGANSDSSTPSEPSQPSEPSEPSEPEPVAGWSDDIKALFQEYIGVEVPYVEMGVDPESPAEWDDGYECVSVYGTEYTLDLCNAYGEALEEAGWTAKVYDYFDDGTLVVDASKAVGEQFAYLNFYGEEGFSELDVYLVDEDPLEPTPAEVLLNGINQDIFGGEGSTMEFFGAYFLFGTQELGDDVTLLTVAQAADEYVRTGVEANPVQALAWDEDYGEYAAVYQAGECVLALSVYADEDDESLAVIQFCSYVGTAEEPDDPTPSSDPLAVAQKFAAEFLEDDEGECITNEGGGVYSIQTYAPADEYSCETVVGMVASYLEEIEATEDMPVAWDEDYQDYYGEYTYSGVKISVDIKSDVLTDGEENISVISLYCQFYCFG